MRMLKSLAASAACRLDRYGDSSRVVTKSLRLAVFSSPRSRRLLLFSASFSTPPFVFPGYRVVFFLSPERPRSLSSRPKVSRLYPRFIYLYRSLSLHLSCSNTESVFETLRKRETRRPLRSHLEARFSSFADTLTALPFCQTK